MTCDKNCIANLNGECCVDECKGKIRMLKPCQATAEQLKRFYEVAVSLFEEDFKESEQE